MRTLRAFVFLPLIASTLHAQLPDPAVTAVIARTNLDSLTTAVAELSGVTPALLNGVSDTIKSRYDTNPGNAKAAVYLGQKLQSYGLTPQLQNFTSGGQNVYATQTGVERPGRYYIICAHYDNMPSTVPAPGADDNASGTAGVIEAARVFRGTGRPQASGMPSGTGKNRGFWGANTTQTFPQPCRRLSSE